MAEQTHSLRYRPEIDGLRAVAVGVVVLFHAGLGCPGGYIGVDVFFVISGFLINSLIWKDLETGKFTFANFWERRARRIMPALAVMVLATMVAGWFLLLPSDFKKLGQAGVSQGVFAANFFYWQDSGYFSEGNDAKPLLHTWSLAVEEQFYFVTPVLMWWLFRSSKLRRRNSMIAVLSGLVALSFLLSIYGVAKRPSATFFLLPTRAWELLLGALPAFVPVAGWLQRSRPMREAVALLAAAMIVLPVAFYTKLTAFPGLAAMPPCLGAALFIWVSGGQAGNVVAWLLKTPVMVFVGLISYSLYLWHWPLLAFDGYLALSPAPVWHHLVVVAISVGISIASWRWVETPFRQRTLAPTRSAMFTTAGAALALIVGLGAVFAINAGFPGRMSAQARAFAASKADGFKTVVREQDVRSDKLIRIGVQGASTQPSVLLWGDSHALAELPAVDELLKEQGLSGCAAGYGATPPVLNWWMPSSFGMSRKDSLSFNRAVLEYIRQHHMSDVILIAGWWIYTDCPENQDGSFERELVQTVAVLREIGTNAWLLLDVPHHSFDVPRALSSPIYSNSYVQSIAATPGPQMRFDGLKESTIAGLKALGCHLIDPKPVFLDSQSHHYMIQQDGVSLYFDEHHLTVSGAKMLLLPLLRQELKLGHSGLAHAG